MKEQKVEKLLAELAQETKESVSPLLAERIKQDIPAVLNFRRPKMDSINIIIDLRISRFAAAAIIIASLILFAALFRGPSGHGDGIYQDGKFLMKYCLAKFDNQPTFDFVMVKARYKQMVENGAEAVYFDNPAYFGKKDAIILYWKISDDLYGVVLGDLTEDRMTAKQLIEHQSEMLMKTRH